MTIPAEVTIVDTGSFADCSKLHTIVFAGNAPDFYDAPFANVKADAYYPEGNATWTADKLLNYGGTIFTHTHSYVDGYCACGTPDPNPKPTEPETTQPDTTEPERPVESQTAITVRFIPHSWFGDDKVTTVTVQPSASIEAPAISGFGSRNKVWKTADGTLIAAPGETLTYEQLRAVANGQNVVEFEIKRR